MVTGQIHPILRVQGPLWVGRMLTPRRYLHFIIARSCVGREWRASRIDIQWQCVDNMSTITSCGSPVGG